MDEDDLCVEAIQRRCRKAVATVLAAKEMYADEFLSDTDQRRFRRIIMNEINELAGLAVALFDEGEDVIVNEYWVRELERVHSGV